MTDDFIKKALEDVVAVYAELVFQKQDLEKQRKVIDQRMARVGMKIISLANLCEDIPEDSLVGRVVKNASKLGLTDAVREVLKATGERMTPPQVRDYLIRMNIKLDRFKNHLASITTVLVRLNDKGEVDMFYDKTTDKVTYQWKVETEDEDSGVRRLPASAASVIASRTAKIALSKESAKKKESNKKK